MKRILEFKLKNQAQEALDKIAKNERLTYTQQSNCAYDNTLAVTMRIKYWEIEIYSNVLSASRINEIVEKL